MNPPTRRRSRHHPQRVRGTRNDLIDLDARGRGGRPPIGIERVGAVVAPAVRPTVVDDDLRLRRGRQRQCSEAHREAEARPARTKIKYLAHQSASRSEVNSPLTGLPTL